VAYGLTEDGFVAPTTAVVRESLNVQLRARFGASIDVGDASILGQMTGIVAAAIATLWEKLEAVNASQDPDKATGTGLDALCAITGTFRHHRGCRRLGRSNLHARRPRDERWERLPGHRRRDERHGPDRNRRGHHRRRHGALDLPGTGNRRRRR
jgi:hypothetical protein